MAENGERRFLRAISLMAILGILVFFAVFSRPLFTGNVYTEDDLSAFNLPLRHFYHRCLHEGDSPIWIPSMFCGFYLHSEGQAGMFHPIHEVLYSYFPLAPAFNLELLASYLAVLPGIYFLLRRRSIPAHAAWPGALLFTFCGFNFTNYLHIMIPAVIAHVPWLLLCIDSLFRARSTRELALPASGIVILTASQLLLGFPQCVYHSLLIEGLYVLLLLWERRPAFPAVIRRIGALAIAKVLALLCGAVQVLPQMNAARHSVRLAPSFEFVMAGSLHPANLLQIVNPYLFNRHGWTPDLAQLWDPPYFTALSPILLLWGLIRFRHLGKHKPLVAGAIVMAAVGLVLALGYYGYIYRLYVLIPWLNKFRNSSRHILLYHLAMTVIVAVAYADLITVCLRREPVARWLWLCIPAALGLATAVAAAFIRLSPDRPLFQEIERHLAPAANIWTGAAIMAVATVLVILASRGRRFAIPLLLMFTIADVAAYSLRHKPCEDLDAFINRIRIPGDCGEYRIDPDFRPVWAYNGAPMRGCSVVSGYAALFPLNRLDYQGGQLAPLRAASCKWRKTRLGGPADLAEAYNRGVEWLEVPDPVSRVRCVAKAIAGNDPARDIGEIDLLSTVLVDEPIELSDSPPGHVTAFTERPGRLAISVDVPSRQMVAISDRYHPGWWATVDGHPVPVHRINGDFMGCVVEAGRHTLCLEFDPDDLKTGKRLTLAGKALALIYFLGLLISKRPIMS